MGNETRDVKISSRIDIQGYLETRSNEEVNSIIRRVYEHDRPAGPALRQGARSPDGGMPQIRNL